MKRRVDLLYAQTQFHIWKKRLNRYINFLNSLKKCFFSFWALKIFFGSDRMLCWLLVITTITALLNEVDFCGTVRLQVLVVRLDFFWFSCTMDLVDIDSYMLHLVIVYIAIGFIEIVLCTLHNSSMPSNWSFWIFCIEI